MSRTAMFLLVVFALTGCTTTREGRRDMTWEQGGYADPEGAAILGHRGAPNRVPEPGS